MRSKLFILLLLIIIPTVTAQSLITTDKQDYIAGETVQLKLTVSEEPLTNAFTINLIKDNQKIKIGAIILKTSPTEYQSYFDIPINIEKGNYKILINNILFIKNNQLVDEKAEKEITIQTINPGYNWLNNQNIKTNIIENSMSILALNNIGFPSDSSFLLSQQDIKSCFPTNNCQVKDTAFALLALNQLNLDTSKTINWLESAQNNIEKGTFSIKITSDIQENATCTINQEPISFSQNIDASQQQIIDCTELQGNTNIELIHTYLGSVNTISTTNKKDITININNKGCFGTNFKSECDYESSLYASYALKKLNKQNTKAITYLRNNYDEFTTLHHIILTLIDNFQYSKDWLINNQQNNSWSKKAITIDTIPDIYTTALAISALKNTIQAENAIQWIKSQQQMDGSWNNILDTATVLYNVFPDDKLSPVLSFTPAIATIYENQPPFKITFINKGYIPITLQITETEAIKTQKTTITLQPASSESTIITVNPNLIEQENLEFTYNNITRSISIIRTKTNLTQELISTPLRFITDEESITFNLRSTEFKEGTIPFKNFAEIELTNLQITLTGDLDEIISLDTTIFNSLAPEEEQEVFARINSKREPRKSSYAGSILITTTENYIASLPIIVNIEGFIEPILLPPIETEPIEEEQEEESEETEEERTKYAWLVWVVLTIIIALIIYLVINKVRKKKQKPKTKESYSVEAFKNYLKKRNN